MRKGRTTYVFIDESGNPNLDDIGKDGVTPMFVIGAVLVAEEKVDASREVVRGVRDRFFQGSPLKSANMPAKSAGRRVEVLAKLLPALDAKFIVLAVDKRAIQKDGPLQYQRTFRKYLASRLYEHIYSTLDDVVVVADQVGGDEYMAGVREYVEKRFPSGLFQRFDHQYVRAADDELVQMADLIAGSFAHAAEGEETDEMRRAIRQAMQIVHVIEYPRLAFQLPENVFEEVNLMILNETVRRADEYISTHHESVDPVIRYRRDCLRFLRTLAVHINPSAWVTASEIIQNIRQPENVLTRRRFNSEVVGPLRDEGQLIASCDNGFKLIAGEGDLARYLTQTSQQVGPNISRAMQLHHAVTMKTGNHRGLLKQIPQLRELMAFLAERVATRRRQPPGPKV